MGEGGGAADLLSYSCNLVLATEKLPAKHADIFHINLGPRWARESLSHQTQRQKTMQSRHVESARTPRFLYAPIDLARMC